MNQENEQLIGAVAPPLEGVAPSSMTQSSQPTIVQFQKTWSLQSERFNSKLARKLGVTQLVMGGLALLLNVTGIMMYNAVFYSHDDWCCSQGRSYNIAPGIWGIILIGLSGGFSLRAAKQKTKCNIMTAMVTSLLSLIVAAVIVAIACWATVGDIKRIRYVNRDSFSDNSDYWDYSDSRVTRLQAYCGLVVSLMFVAAGIALVVTCCRTVVVCARVVSCGSQSGSMSNCGDSLMQVVDSEGKPVPGARIIQVPAGSSDAHQLLANPTSGLDPDSYNTSRWSCIISCVRNRGNECDHIKPPPYLQ